MYVDKYYEYTVPRTMPGPLLNLPGGTGAHTRYSRLGQVLPPTSRGVGTQPPAWHLGSVCCPMTVSLGCEHQAPSAQSRSPARLGSALPLCAIKGALRPPATV